MDRNEGLAGRFEQERPRLTSVAGDFDALVSLLHPDVVLRADLGGGVSNLISGAHVNGGTIVPVNDELAMKAFASMSAFEKWLSAEGSASPGVWLKIAKADSGIPTVTYAEALDIALCHGWIDGKKDKFDEEYWLQRFTPRRARSKWSEVNRLRAQELVKLGRMKPAGQKEMDAAQADGRWDQAYASQKTARVPDDLQAAFDANPTAKAFFATLDSRNRYAVLYRVGDAKKAETRAARIEKFVAMLNAHESIYP
jgi:uncharacterized protein YdeI (YjbR/CyaY-like superfamily)